MATQRSTAEHDTEANQGEFDGFVPSICVGSPQLEPLSVTALPLPSTATQKVAEAHEIEFMGRARVAFGSIRTVDPQEVPLSVTALPLPSTATQKVAEGHEIEVIAAACDADESINVGSLHVDPLNVTA
jgi:hypothetical protein